MPFDYILNQIWNWLCNTGFNVGLLIVLCFLVPRIGRLAMRLVERKVVNENTDESKTQLAVAGVVIYIAQLIAYFILSVFILKQLGFSLAGAAIPAAAASAAIGLGAQSIIADFLAGFFILTEKQYGVGDWVRFEGGAATIEGTVIQITMRSTRLRTLAEETVIIPNSKAGIAINNSNYWSSAVLTMPVPLLGSSSMNEVIQRATNAARRALRRPDIAPEILSELTVHEPIDMAAPATSGLTWTADLRFLCQVKPGSQWKVERAIRTAIVDEFWTDYGDAPVMDSVVEYPDKTEFIQKQAKLPDTFDKYDHVIAEKKKNASKDPSPTSSWSPIATTAAASQPLVDANKESDSSTSDKHLKDPAADDSGDNTATTFIRPQDDNDVAPASSHPTTEPAGLPADALDKHTSDTAALVEKLNEPRKRKWANEDHNLTGWRKVITLGGRMRVSTAVLILVGLVLLIFKGLTLEPGDDYQGSNGWLAPDNRPAASTTSTPEETYEPSTTTESTPTSTEESSTPTSTETGESQNPSATPTTSDERQPGLFPDILGTSERETPTSSQAPQTSTSAPAQTSSAPENNPQPQQ